MTTACDWKLKVRLRCPSEYEICIACWQGEVWGRAPACPGSLTFGDQQGETAVVHTTLSSAAYTAFPPLLGFGAKLFSQEFCHAVT